MALPVNIEELINGNTVEWERIEFRKGWNLPTILKELAKNKSPKPVFETDEERSYFKTTFFIHPEFKGVNEGVKEATPQVTPQAAPQVDRKKRILEFCKIPRKREEIKRHVGIKDLKYFRENILTPLINAGLLQMTIPDKQNSPKQKYVITEKGKKLLKDSEEGENNE